GFRQRDRPPLQRARGRQPSRDGYFLPGYEAQSLAVLPETRFCVRRLVLAQGSAGATLQGENARCLASHHRRDLAEQRAADRACGADRDRKRQQEGRHTRVQLQGGHGRLRESPVVELTERLIGKGYDLRVYDANVK